MNALASQIHELPANVSAEQALLGSIILDNDALDALPAGFAAGDFYRRPHQDIFELMLELHDLKRPIDILTITEQSRATSRGIEPAYVAKLSEVVPSSAHVADYARIVMDLAIRRALIHRLRESIELANDDTVAVRDAQVQIETKLTAIEDRRRDWVTAREAANEHLRDVDAAFEGRGRRAFKTGFPALDSMLYIQDTDFVVVGARPGEGKSTLLWQFARSVAEREGPVLYVSIEMPRTELAMRAAMDMASLPVEDARKPRNDAAADKLSRSMEEFAKLPIIFGDSRDPLVILREAARLKRKRGLRAVFLDYLQLVRIPYDWGDNRDQRIGELTRRMRAFAMDQTIPLLTASQLKRRDHLMRGQDPRPNLDDLRESGNIEQDATTVLFVYRPGTVEGTEEHKRNDERTTQLIVAKQRGGRAGVASEAVAQFEYARFAEPESERQTAMF